MFAGTGAEAVCADQSLEPGYAIANGAGANLTPVSSVRTQGQRTITARDVPIPLEDAFSPVIRARVPVPGLNQWPGRYNRLGRKYYGLSAGVDAKTSAKLQKAFTKPSGFAGLGAFEPGWDDHLGLPPVMPPLATTPPISGSSNSGFSWNNLFGTIAQTLPATISAARGGGVPYGYYPNQGYYYPNQQGEVVQAGSAANAGALAGAGLANLSNSVSTFVSQNPLLVLGGTVAMVLLFTRPPSRR